MEQSSLMKIEIAKTLSVEETIVLTTLYQPLMKEKAFILYNSLYSIKTANFKIKNHQYILSLTNSSMIVFEETRKLLENFLLLKTFYVSESDTYIYKLLPPLKACDFLNDDLFGRLYLKEMGLAMYKFTLNNLKKDVNYDNAVDITSSSDIMLIESWNENDEEKFNQVIVKEEDNDNIPVLFDLTTFLTITSKFLFPEHQRTTKNLELITKLGSIYGLSPQDMKQCICKCIDEESNKLDPLKLKSMVKNKKIDYKEIDDEIKANRYRVAPVTYLANLQGGKVAKSEKDIIDFLAFELKLKFEVINVLIEFCIENNNGKIIRNYIETVASSWKRMGIDTAKKALEEKDNYKKVDKNKYKKPISKQELPKWKTPTKEDYENTDGLEELLNEIKGLSE